MLIQNRNSSKILWTFNGKISLGDGIEIIVHNCDSNFFLSLNWFRVINSAVFNSV